MKWLMKRGWMYGAMALISAFALFPVYWVVITSLKPRSEIYTRTPDLWPSDPQWSQYPRVLGEGHVGRALLNSLMHVIVDEDLACRGDVRAHDRLGASGGIRRQQRRKQAPIDEQRMAVPVAMDGTHDRRVGFAVAVQHAAHRRGRDERNVDERHERGADAGAIDEREPGLQRRQLSSVVVAVHREPGGQAALQERVSDRLGLMTEHHDNVVDVRVEQGADDARKKRIAIVDRERRLGPTHARRASSCEHDRRNHQPML